MLAGQFEKTLVFKTTSKTPYFEPTKKCPSESLLLEKVSALDHYPATGQCVLQSGMLRLKCDRLLQKTHQPITRKAP